MKQKDIFNNLKNKLNIPDECSTHEAADLLKVTFSTIIAWIEKGKIKNVRVLVGGHRRIPYSEVERLGDIMSNVKPDVPVTNPKPPVIPNSKPHISKPTKQPTKTTPPIFANPSPSPSLKPKPKPKPNSEPKSPPKAPIKPPKAPVKPPTKSPTKKVITKAPVKPAKKENINSNKNNKTKKSFNKI